MFCTLWESINYRWEGSSRTWEQTDTSHMPQWAMQPTAQTGHREEISQKNSHFHFSLNLPFITAGSTLITSDSTSNALLQCIVLFRDGKVLIHIAHYRLCPETLALPRGSSRHVLKPLVNRWLTFPLQQLCQVSSTLLCRLDTGLPVTMKTVAPSQ